ncbi:hypothetical protein BDZ89DRAFT_1071063 [Hymenopellis radicata]|nr:hypothetical protein BDZ89DRAFT_1071063 [Hymenopellis radicata]
MHPAYQSETIPWHLFVRHVQITSTSSSDESEFAIQGSSTIEARDADFTVFAGSLASAIADDAERRRSTVPKPNASIQAWRDLGVDDDALFPDEYLSRVAGMHRPSAIVPDPQQYTQKVTWEERSSLATIGTHRAVSALLVVAMTEPPNQFQFLPALLRLAQSIKIKLAAMAGFHYSLPPRRSYEKDYDKGIIAYVNLTFSNFLLVNIILAVARDRDCHSDLLRLARQSQAWDPPLATNNNGNPLDAAGFEDRLHHDFWRTLREGPRPTQSELLEKMHHYGSRCFNFLVSWYAVMTESFFTARALHRTYPVYFGPEQLTAVILLQLQNLGSAFNVHSLDASDPVAFVRRFNTPSADLTMYGSDHRACLAAAPVSFLSLPPELHLCILSYLPTRALLSIMGVCTQLRKVCPELIYTNPMGIIDDFHPLYHNYIDGDPGVVDVISRRFSKLLALLLAQPELCLRLRTFTLRACGVPEDPRFRHSKYGFNIHDPIVERMINLSHLNLLVPHPICATCAARDSSWCKERLQYIIPDLIRRWPCLQALTISYLPRDASLDHDAAESPHGAPRCIEPADRDPSWSLQSLEVKQSDLVRNALPAEQQDLHLLCHLVKMSAHALRRLDLHPQSLGAIGDLGMFPLCPLVEHFSIRSALTGPLLRLLLRRCFPAITFLHVSFDTTFAGFTIFVEDFGPLDLSECKLLRHAAVDLYPISGFPPCAESLDLGVGFNVNHISATSHTMKAVHLANKVTYIDGPDGDRQARVVLDSLGRAFPDLYCLDMALNEYAKDKDTMMDTLSSIVASSLPNLSILILTLSYGLLSFRLRRSDFPSDDGGDRRQHDYAVVFFRACPSLNIISFNGAPFEDSPAFIQPDRVWRRASVDAGVEAQMTGGESLPWKIGQSRRIDQSKMLWLG